MRNAFTAGRTQIWAGAICFIFSSILPRSVLSMRSAVWVPPDDGVEYLEYASTGTESDHPAIDVRKSMPGRVAPLVVHEYS